MRVLSAINMRRGLFLGNSDMGPTYEGSNAATGLPGGLIATQIPGRKRFEASKTPMDDGESSALFLVHYARRRASNQLKGRA